MAPAELKTARLTLRAPQDDDATWIAAEISRPEVHSMLTSPPHPYGLADAKAWLARSRTCDWQYVIVADEPVGIVTLDSPVWGQELGYWLRPSAWGKGYMTEAARAVVGAWFAQGEDTLNSGHLTENAGSAGVLAKLGFRYTGALMRQSGFYGRAVEVQRMQLSKAAFTAALPWEAESPRLTYRPMQATDADALHAIVSHFDVTRQLGPKWPWPADPAFTITRAQPFHGPGFVWGIFRDGSLIGTVGVSAGELGYMLAPAAWGQGLATEACRTAIAHAFAQGLDHIDAGVWSDNLASQHVLTKLGFKVTGGSTGTSPARPTASPGLTLTRSRP